MELFAHRNFTCDCGTTRFPAESPCTLRINPVTGTKGSVHSEEASSGNTYNHNFRNYFCGCGELYDAHKQKGTMYQCIGLATEQEGGCGEDWWHSECLIGWRRDWYLSEDAQKLKKATRPDADAEDDDHLVVPGFREEFANLICYKCVDTNPWIKKYAASNGFMVLPHNPQSGDIETKSAPIKVESNPASIPELVLPEIHGETHNSSRKRKAEDDQSETESIVSKRTKADVEPDSKSNPIHTTLPAAPTGSFSLLALDDDFRTRFCRCPACYPTLSKFPQLLEEEDLYEPPESEDEEADGPGSVGTKSLLERGEAALSNVDRVRAIGKRVEFFQAILTRMLEGVMAYNHLRDKVKSFLKPFAESGEAVSAEHIKAYFEKLRGDDQAMREAVAAAPDGGIDPDNRREESSK